MERAMKWKRRAVVLLVVVFPALGAAQTKSGEPLPQSVTFSIDEAAENFNKAVGSGLAQRLSELQVTLKDASARVHTALERAQKEQTEDANNSYENVISGELLNVQTALHSIVGEQGSVLQAHASWHVGLVQSDLP